MEAAFDAYFRAADLDRDGRINGQEVVAFFKGSGLPQPVLAQIEAAAIVNRGPPPPLRSRLMPQRDKAATVAQVQADATANPGRRHPAWCFDVERT